ncbi:hypothetical protein B0G84_4967 [Paraburkholderia sp. BL8N3]|nr:hypothetical protein [Paraburkholderia sp. BL8N3]TCK39627.1 hypothetical protein B0G84_4967 [Paraburkholderia sp. BL8N3]
MKKILFGALLALLSAASCAATFNAISLLNPAGSSAGQAIVSTGPTSAPVWGGVSVNGIAPISANAVLANATGSSAAPTAFAMPSCSTSNSALQWSNGSGFNCLTGVARTGNPLSQFAATTSAQLLGVISDETGSGALVFGTAPTLSQPNIVGTTTNNNANAGNVGEYVSSTVLSGSAVSATTATAANVTSISLTAGDWDVAGVVAVAPAGTTQTTSLQGGISTTSAAQPSIATGGSFLMPGLGSAGAGVGVGGALAPFRMSLAGTTTVFLVCTTTFTVSTNACYGTIRARRIR